MIAVYKYSLYLLFVSLDKHPSVPLLADICRCYLNNNEDEIPYGTAGYNSLFKIQPALDIIKKTFSECYRPAKNMSIDEAMVAFKGRTHLKRYLPSKPIQWGFKIWTIAESSTGYIWIYWLHKKKNNQKCFTSHKVFNVHMNYNAIVVSISY